MSILDYMFSNQEASCSHPSSTGLTNASGYGSFWSAIEKQAIPGGTSWFYVLGSSLLFLFIVQMLTGIFLALYYVPTPDHAHASVKFIQEEAAFGSFVRGHASLGRELHDGDHCVPYAPCLYFRLL